jgi:hypothetical protein
MHFWQMSLTLGQHLRQQGLARRAEQRRKADRQPKVELAPAAGQRAVASCCQFRPGQRHWLALVGCLIFEALGNAGG